MKLKELFTARDMTEGAPWKRIAEFAVPMLLGNLAQQLYNTADTVIVGRYVGDNALSAVGSAAPILNLLLALFVGVSTGAGICVSQYFGARNRELLSRTIGNCITLSAIATGLIMVVGTAVAMPLLRLLGTPESIIYWCADYLHIFFLGSGGFFFYNMLSGVLRGMGDSLSALLYLLLATALNVALDIVFVASFGMGVPGVALATVLAQFISAFACLHKLLKMRDIFDLNWEQLKLKKNYALRIIKIGLPSGVTQAIFSISMLAVQSITNTLGEMVIACDVMIVRVDGFAMMPNMSFGQAMSVYTGQNVGAKLPERVKSGRRQGLALAVGTATVMTAAIVLLGHHLFGIFTETEELIDLAVRMMRILAFGYICVSVTQVLGGVMRGAGDTVTPMWISLGTTILFRVPMAYLCIWLSRTEEFPKGQPQALFISLLMAWMLGAIVSSVAFARGKWKRSMEESWRQMEAEA